MLLLEEEDCCLDRYCGISAFCLFGIGYEPSTVWNMFANIYSVTVICCTFEKKINSVFSGLIFYNIICLAEVMRPSIVWNMFAFISSVSDIL